MAKGSALPFAAPISGSERIFLVQDGVTRTASASDLADAAGNKGDPGGTPASVGLATQVAGLNIPVGTDLIQTSGYSQKRIGFARYGVVAESDAEADALGLVVSADTLRSQNARWWRLIETIVTPDMFGAVGNCVIDRYGNHTGTDDRAAVQKAIDWACRPGLQLCGTVRLDRTHLINGPLLVNNAFKFTMEGQQGALVAGPGLGFGDRMIMVRDTVESDFRFFGMVGNANLPDGLIELQNTGGHNRTTNAMARITIEGLRFDNYLGWFGCTRVIRITDTQQKMDNNSEHRIINCHFWGYSRSAISIETRNSLQNQVFGNVFENPPVNNSDCYLIETVSVMRALVAGGPLVEQGGGGFIFSGGEAIIHGGLSSTTSNAACLFYLRGDCLHDVEISNLTVEDNCRFLDIDVSPSTDTSILKVTLTNCHQKGGVSGVSGSPINFINLKTGARRLICDMIGTSINLGRPYANINLDGANVHLNVAGGVLNSTAITGTGHVVIMGAFSAPGTMDIANTLASFSAFGFQGTYTYKGFTVAGAGSMNLFAALNMYSNINLKQPGSVFGVTTPNGGSMVLRAADDGVFRANSVTSGGVAGDQRDMLAAKASLVTGPLPNGTTLPSGAQGWMVVRHAGGYRAWPVWQGE